jgi:hypothetical protein
MSQRVRQDKYISLKYVWETKSNTKASQIQFKVTGKVQGVCFRSFTAEKAKGLNLTGHVKNESDGSVCYLETVITRVLLSLTIMAGHWRSTRRREVTGPIRAASQPGPFCGESQQC